MNSSMLTGKFYTMDPETEDLIRGEDLQNGMVVMIEGNLVREDPESLRDSKYAQARLMENNRWCEVTDLRFRGYDSSDSSRQVDFIGVYADGTKASRTFSTSYAWFVKKDSLPVKETYPEPGKVVDFSDMPDHDRPVGSEISEKNPHLDETHTSNDKDSITLTQIGTGMRTTIPREELVKTYGQGIKLSKDILEDHSVGTITGVGETAEGLTIQATLSDDEVAHAIAEADATEALSDDLDLNEEGPLVRAMRVEFEPQLREKRTVTKTTVVETYGPPRRSPFYGGRARW